MLKALCAGSVFADHQGAGPPLVAALHGWGRSRTDFQETLRGLDSVALDLPGFGLAPAPPKAWGSADYADLVARALGEVGSDFVVLGHSFGGRVAVQLATRHPELVRGLVLTGVPLVRMSRKAPPAGYRLVKRLHAMNLVSGAVMDRARQKYGSRDYVQAQGVLRDVLVRVVNESYDDLLPRIACPVDLVWGANDAAVPVAVAESAMHQFTESKLTVVPGVGHFTPEGSPGALREAVDRQLARARS